MSAVVSSIATPCCAIGLGHRQEHAVHEHRTIGEARELGQQALRFAEGVAEEDRRHTTGAILVPPGHDLAHHDRQCGSQR